MAKKTRSKRPAPSAPPKDAAGQSHWLARHPYLAALGIYSLLAMIFFFEVLFGGKTYISPDAQTATAVITPLKKAFWERGGLVMWTPYIFCGMPSLASLMFPFFYLPSFMIELISRFLPLPALTPHVLHFIFAGMGVFVFLRRKGASFWPALFGGTAFMFMPYLITMEVFGHGSQMMTSAYIPWALWAVDRLIEKFSWRNLALAGLILGFQLQRGHVQIAYYSLMMVGLYVLFHLIYFIIQKYYGRLLPTLGGVAGALILAGALAAVLFLPLQEYTPFSIRGSPSVLQAAAGTKDTGVGFEYATQWSFSPGEMMTFIIPSFYGFGGQPFYWGNMPFTDYPNYMGILILAFAIAAFVLYLPKPGPEPKGSLSGPKGGLSPRLLVMFLGTTILLALLLSFGYHFASFYKLFYNYLPYFNKFRVPAMVLILVQCAVAILAGLGLEGILSRLRTTGTGTKDEIAARRQFARRLWIALAVLAAVVLLLTVLRGSFFDFMRSLYPDQYESNYQEALDKARFDMLFKDIWIVFFVAAGGITMVALAAAQKISATTAAVVIGLITLADLWLVDKKIGNTYPQTESTNFLQPDAIIQFLQADSSVYRIYPAGQLFGELRWSGQGFQSVGGYHAAKPRLYQDFIEAAGLQGANLPAHHVVDMLNAKYIITFETLSDTNFAVRQQFQTGNGVLSIYENLAVLPRAHLVGEYAVEADPVTALTRIRTGPEANGKGFDPHRQVLLNEEPELKPQPDHSRGLSPSEATAQITQYDFHEVMISTQSSSPQMLVLSDNYYPVGWQAYVDNQPVKTYRANYCFRAISIPAGTHQVEFRFHSKAFTRGLWVSITALVVAVVLLFFAHKRPPATT